MKRAWLLATLFFALSCLRLKSPRTHSQGGVAYCQYVSQSARGRWIRVWCIILFLPSYDLRSRVGTIKVKYLLALTYWQLTLSPYHVRHRVIGMNISIVSMDFSWRDCMKNFRYRHDNFYVFWICSVYYILEFI